MPKISALPAVTSLTELTDIGVGVVAGVTSKFTFQNLAVDIAQPDGVARTLDPRLVTANPTFSGANRAVYCRSVGYKAAATGVVIYVATSSGNISVAVYPSNGSNGTAARPSGSRKATTGTIACPSSGLQTVTFTTTVDIDDGDWIALSCDNTTAAFGTQAAMVATGAGVSYFEASAHPCPATVGSLTAFSRSIFASTE